MADEPDDMPSRSRRPRSSSTGSTRNRTVMANVAELAGVSQMTVSRVINGTGRVSSATREKVLAAMRELDYQPNTAARALVTGRSSQLGVIAHSAGLFGPSSTLHAIEQTARDAGYSVSTVTVDAFGADVIRGAVDDLRGRPVDGLVIMTPHQSAVDVVDDLQIGLPVVTVHGRTADLPAVTIDQRAGARRATELLLSLGHRNVWHIAGPQEWLEARERAETWRSVLIAADIEPPRLMTGDWSARSGYEIGRELLADGSQVTAIFAANDQMALGVYRAAFEAGRRIPVDLSIVGFDDIPEAAYFAPPLTTVRQDFEHVGRSSIEVLLDEFEHGGGGPRRRLIDADVVLRDSTAAPG